MWTENDLIKFVVVLSVSLVTFDIVLHNVKAQTVDQFLNEDQSMVCKHQMHLGYGNDKTLVCVTVQDDQMEYSIFEDLMTDRNTYEFD